MHRLRVALAVLLTAVVTSAFAQDYPTRPVKIVVPFAAGGPADVYARFIAQRLQEAMGQPFVVEDRPGGGSVVGTDIVAKSTPDGYTLLIHSAGHVANPAIYPNLPYDTLADFAAVTTLASLPNVLVVAPSKGYRNVQDLVDQARAKPGTLNFATAGHGSATHMNTEIFRLSAKFEATHIPFKGTPEALTETSTGRVDFFFAPLSPAIPLIKDGRLKALAVGTLQRSPLLPEVPTTTEAGFAQSEYVFWVGLFAPAGTPRPVVERLYNEAVKALAMPEVRDKLTLLGAEPIAMTPSTFDEFLRVETRRAADVVRRAGIKLQ